MGINSWAPSPLPDSQSKGCLGSSNFKETGARKDILAPVFLAKVELKV